MTETEKRDDRAGGATPGAAGHGPDARLWERRPDESPKAYHAFSTYRDLAASRSLILAARTLRKAYSLVRRWAKRHEWERRVWAWDVAQSRQDEAAVRHQRDESIRQFTDDSFRIWRVAISYFWTLIKRDPETGRPAFGPDFTPAVALKFCELALRVQTALGQRPDSTEAEEPADPFQFTNVELREAIAFARELTKGKEHEDDEITKA